MPTLAPAGRVNEVRTGESIARPARGLGGFAA